MDYIDKEKHIENYLFNDAKSLLENKYYYFWVIDTKDKDTKEEITQFFMGLIKDLLVYEKSSKLILVFFERIDFDLENIVASLLDDFSYKFSLYASPKMYFDNNNFLSLFNLYDKYYSLLNRQYITTGDLLSIISNINYVDFEIMKPFIIRPILEDEQMLNLVNAMFEASLNVSKTADLVYMHRNTIIKRLENLKNETGVNIQKFKEAVLVYELLK